MQKALKGLTEKVVESADEGTGIDAGHAGYAAYPPVVTEAKIEGYLHEMSHIEHSRDIGRPFNLLGEHHVVFGDTFCKNKAGEFVGVANNTVAYVPLSAYPRLTKYLEYEENEMVKLFVPLTEEEKEFEKQPGGGRVCLWMFGGVVELDDGTGRVWYDKSIERNQVLEYVGTGIAKITPKLHGKLHVHRLGDVKFGPDKPRVGTFSTIAHGSFIYLYGNFGYGDRPGHNIVLARVHKDKLEHANHYTYWNGEEYVSDWNEAVTVFEKMQAGMVFRSKLFGSSRPFVFVGNNGWADSKVVMGASASLEGPWETQTVCQAKGLNYKDTIMYCMYPHLWASKVEEGELMVTWSEQWPGGVVAAKLKLAPVDSMSEKLAPVTAE